MHSRPKFGITNKTPGASLRFQFAAANFGVENETSGEIDDSLLTSSFEIPTVFEQAGQNQPMPHGLPGARGFRARWKAKSQAMHDELSRWTPCRSPSLILSL